MKSRFMALMLSFLVSMAPDIYAYELATHGYMTWHAYNESIVRGDFLLQELGINGEMYLGGKEEVDSIFKFSYFDIKTNDIRKRLESEFSKNYMPRSEELGNNKKIPLQLPGWLMRGAIREDDNPDAVKDFGQPNDDPYQADYPTHGGFHWKFDPIRVVNHFFDPALNRPIGPSFYEFRKAVDWAIGASDSLADENENEADRHNHFTVHDARESMFRALVGARWDRGNNKLDKLVGLKCPEPDAMGVFTNCEVRNANEQDRLAYWATTFRALGDVVHLVQDMSQPQHTRNDPHAGSEYALVEEYITGHKSEYEWYIEARATGAPEYEVGGKGMGIKYKNHEPLKFGEYPVPVFNRYSDIFSTHQGKENIGNGKGLADYTNRGFFTVGTNLGNNPYLYPSNNRADYATTSELADSGSGVVTSYLYNAVYDRLNADKNAYGVPLATESAWKDSFTDEDDILYGHEIDRFRYSLDLTIYGDMANLTIPRAVAYSAGLINYFFRGRIEIAPPKDGIYALIDHSPTHARNDAGIAYAGSTIFGFNTLKIQVRDATKYNNDALSGGQLRAVVKYRLNACYQPNLSAEIGLDGKPNTDCTVEEFQGMEEKIAVSDPQAVSLSKADFKEIKFTFSGDEIIPVIAHSLHLQVVYRGALGSEADAVVVATHDIAEPTFFSIINNTNYLCLKGEMKYLPEISAEEWAAEGLAYDLVAGDMPNIAITFGNATNPQVKLDNLPVDRYSRLVLLTENTPLAFKTAGARLSGRQTTNTPNVVQYDALANATPTIAMRGSYQRKGTMRTIIPARPWTAEDEACKDFYDSSAVSDAAIAEMVKPLVDVNPMPVTELNWPPAP